MDSGGERSGLGGVRAPHEAHRIEIKFTGSGGEYFRIWIVNILLTLLTLGLYLPWAKVRRLRYFYNHTDVQGYALDFHGNPWRMLRGTLFMGVFLLVYANAPRIAPMAGFVAAVVLVAVWPALARTSMQFRTANTSWRGMRFGFHGSMAGIYAAMTAPMALLLLPLAWLGATADPKSNPQAFAAGLSQAGVALAIFAVSAPFFYWLFKRYQHGGYGYGGLRTELRTTVGSSYGLALRCVGVALLAGLALALLVALVAGVGVVAGLISSELFTRKGPAQGVGAALAVVAVVVLVTVFYLILVILIRSYWVSRAQNLIWSRTGNRYMRFRSVLAFRKILGLTMKNWLLMLLTLGFYWPFASVAMYRARIEAVTLVSRVAIDNLTAGAQQARNDATGDMAADLVGLDFGL